MKNIVIQLFIFIFFLSPTVKAIDLTEEEKKYIASTPKVKIAMMPDFTNFSYLIEDTPVGFEHDFLELISRKTGLNFEKKFSSWTSNYNSFKNKEIDVISSISYEKNRTKFVDFTDIYYEIPIMVFVRDDFGEYLDIHSLKYKRIGVIRDSYYINELQDIGAVELVAYETHEEITKELALGKIDALIQNPSNISNLIKRHGYTNIKLAGKMNLRNSRKEDLRFGIQPEKLLLSSIFKKGLDSITTKEREDLIKKWIGEIKEYAGGYVELTENEVEYLEKKTIKYCINPTGLPLEGFDEDNKHAGMSSDYYSFFEKIISAKFQLVRTKNWPESLSYMKQEKCDMLALAMETDERKSYLSFTEHYLDVPMVVATKIDEPFINDILDLKGRKIGVLKGHVIQKILASKYPSLMLVEVDDIHQGLDKVKNGEIFSFIETLASIGYEFQKKHLGELKIAGKISEELQLSIAVIKSDEVLLNILQKTISSITNDMHKKIFTKWVPMKYENGVDYSLVWKVAAAAIILVILIFYWNMILVRVKVKAKDDFLAIMSHELRTPMNAISGLSTLLRFSYLDKTQKSYVEKLEASSGYMMQLINNILDFSKVKNNGFEILKQGFHIDITLTSVTDILKQKAEDKGLELNLIKEGLLSEAIIGDRGHLTQILINLISNAIKYTEEGEVSLIVKQLSPPNDTSVRLEFSVVDTGIGIASENTKNLFDPYQRLTNSSAALNEGVGLGLAISKSLVELMGGKLQIESKLGEGSRFYFDLVFDIAEDYMVPAELSSTGLSNFVLPTGIHVLLTDDAPLNRYVGGEMIKNMGGDVSLASTGEAAIVQMKQRSFDVILMDISLPGKDGFEVSQWVRQHGLNPNVPIIALTAFDLTQVKEKCLEVGINGFLHKPFKYQDLYQAISRVLEKNQT